MKTYSLIEVLENIKPGEKYNNVDEDFKLKSIRRVSGGIYFDIGSMIATKETSFYADCKFYKVEPKKEINIAMVEFTRGGEITNYIVLENQGLELGSVGICLTRDLEPIGYGKIINIRKESLTKQEITDYPCIARA